LTSPQDQRWNARLETYRAFVARTGRHPRRPAESAIEAQLSEWAHEQRRLYRGQRGHPMRESRILALEAVEGWVWVPRRGPTPRADHWESRRLAVVRFFEEHGHYPRLGATDADERRLAGWVKNQVERLPGRHDELGQSRYRAVLATPGWPVKRVETWLSMVQRLERFVAENGRMPARTPPRSSDISPDESDERELSMWCANQRRFERAAKPGKPYPEERRARLERIDGWTWAKRRPRSRARQTKRPSSSA
jgi:hypothetical protein